MEQPKELRYNNYLIYIEKAQQDLKQLLEAISNIQDDIIQKTRELKEKTSEAIETQLKINEAMKDYKTMISEPIVSVPSITSKLAELPETGTSSKIQSSLITMTDRVKYSKEYIQSYDQINKFYDYKSNNSILRCNRITKYPRFICKENANPEVVYKLFVHGFIDKIIVDETLYSISKLPSIITNSVLKMIEKHGKGTYGVQVFDASSDTVGKPIALIQIFKTGKNTSIEGDNTSLNMKIPCKLEDFKLWLCEKRASGLSTIRGKLEEMLRNRKVTVIYQSRGGEFEEIITICYIYETLLNNDLVSLDLMLDRIQNLKHTHANETLQYLNTFETSRKKPTVTIVNPLEKVQRREEIDPFA